MTEGIVYRSYRGYSELIEEYVESPIAQEGQTVAYFYGSVDPKHPTPDGMRPALRVTLPMDGTIATVQRGRFPNMALPHQPVFYPLNSERQRFMEWLFQKDEGIPSDKAEKYDLRRTRVGDKFQHLTAKKGLPMLLRRVVTYKRQ